MPHVPCCFCGHAWAPPECPSCCTCHPDTSSSPNPHNTTKADLNLKFLNRALCCLCLVRLNVSTSDVIRLCVFLFSSCRQKQNILFSRTLLFKIILDNFWMIFLSTDECIKHHSYEWHYGGDWRLCLCKTSEGIVWSDKAQNVDWCYHSNFSV